MSSKAKAQKMQAAATPVKARAAVEIAKAPQAVEPVASEQQAQEVITHDTYPPGTANKRHHPSHQPLHHR